MSIREDVLVPGRSPTRTELAPYYRVHDVEDPDGVLVVVDVADARASVVELTAGVTVADVHTEYPPTDPVVAVIYERALERAEPRWATWDPRSLFCRLQAIDAPLQLYPASRLTPYDAGNYTEVVDGVRCEPCQSVLASASEWVAHAVRGCDEV